MADLGNGHDVQAVIGLAIPGARQAVAHDIGRRTPQSGRCRYSRRRPPRASKDGQADTAVAPVIVLV